jgi:hypothetical protein
VARRGIKETREPLNGRVEKDMHRERIARKCRNEEIKLIRRTVIGVSKRP